MITKNAIPPYRKQSSPYVPPRKKIVKTFKKARNVMVPTNMSAPSTPISQGDGNQSHPEHKRRGVLIPHSQRDLAV